MSNGVTVFRGVPFAVAERFRPPRMLPLHDLPAAGGDFGKPSAQIPDPLDYMWGERLAPGAEDCLNLNVYTPDVNGKLPVMVWLHGGAFIIGSGRWPWFDATKLVEEQQIVVVTINYRLGALGYLDLSELGQPDSGNHGLLDQIAALEWVKANIARFGGDPEAVTVAGQSAGGISVCCLLGIPRAKGLFRRAIAMSGSPALVRSREYARRVTQRFLTAAGVSTFEQLLKLSLAEILTAQLRTLKQTDFVGEVVYGPTVGDSVLSEPPLHLVRKAADSGVSLLTGTTADEARLWTLYNPILRVLPFGAMKKWLKSLDLSPGEVRAAYRQDRPDLGLGTLATGLAGDSLFWMPHLRLAEVHPNSHLYLIRWRTPVLSGRLGSLHGVEIPLMFGSTKAKGTVHMIGDADAAEPMSAVMRCVWGAFVRTGNPNCPAVPHWPAFDPTTRPTMMLDVKPTLANDPLPAMRKVWNGLPFDGTRPSMQQLPRIKDVLAYLGVIAGAVALVVIAVIAAVVIWVMSR